MISSAAIQDHARSCGDELVTSIDSRYLAHYRPLVEDFIQEVESTGLAVPAGVPQPFLPLFGFAYERSSLRMVIVGQDTKYWGSLKSFIEHEKASPGRALNESLAEFRTLEFVNWGTTRYHFWGFAMMFLAALHGRDDWGVMKRRARREILSSFAWGNGNAIEYYGSSPKDMPPEAWHSVRIAGERFNGIGHLVETLRPRVVVVLWKDMNPESYFAECDYTEFEECRGVRHYRIASEDLDVFHVPHPGRMRWEGLPADHYCRELVQRLEIEKLAAAFPPFVQQHSDSEGTIALLKAAAPRAFDKFQVVEWVAEELKKRDSFMSVPTLCSLLNDLGYRTNYGTEYEGGRGAYRLIASVYHRLDDDDKSDRAAMVAEAFRTPDFRYAYDR